MSINPKHEKHTSDSAEFDVPAIVAALNGLEAVRDGSIELDVLETEIASVQEVLELIERTRTTQDGDTNQFEGSNPTHIVASLGTPDNKNTQRSLATEPALEEVQRIGRFEIVKQLGQGSYGLVFLAHDTELDRQVALKVPRPEAVITDELCARFLREGKAAALLSHPNIVPVFETGRVGSVCYIVSQYVDGVTLATWIGHAQRCTPTLAARLVTDLADAVQHAHSKGVVHRDLKPANVILDLKKGSVPICAEHPPGRPGKLDPTPFSKPRITDFGLARMMGDQNLLTGTGAIMGTPSYMSPEQAHGTRAVEAATDVYSLGAILYELLTGRPPFVGESVLDTLRQVQQSEPVAPHRLTTGLSPDLEAICLKCLEKQPTRRYDSAQSLSDDLRRYLDQTPVHARPVTQWQRAGKWCRRNPLAAALASTSVMLLLAALVASLSGWWSASSALNREQAALAVAARRYEETKGAVDKYFVMISEDSLLRAPGLKPLRKQLLTTALEHYESLLGEHQADSLLIDELREAHYRIASIQEELGEFPAARASYEEALRLVDESLGHLPEDSRLLRPKGMILRHLAGLDRRDNSFPQALKLIDSSIAINRRLIELSPTDVNDLAELGMQLANKASMLHRMGSVREAEDLYAQSEQLFSELMSQVPEKHEYSYRFAQMHGNRAIMLRQQGKTDESKKLLEETTQLLKQLADSHPEELRFFEDLGKALANLSTYAAAEQDSETELTYLREATVIFDRLACIHPQVVMYQALRASTRSEAGKVLAKLPRYDEAAEMLREGLSIIRTVCEANPNAVPYRSELASIRLRLGVLDVEMEEFGLALAELDTAEAMFQDLLRTMPNDLVTRLALATCQENRARAYAGVGRSDSAMQELAAEREHLESLHRDLPDNMNVRALLATNRALTATILWRTANADGLLDLIP